MAVRKDLAGQRFERLVAVSYSHTNQRKHAVWACRCDCGKTTLVPSHALTTGNTKSCGCLKIDLSTARLRKHGHNSVRGSSGTYKSWCNMIQRCTNPAIPGYKNYGGRGIAVCERWRSSFANFLADMGEKPAGTSIDRVNNDGNYEPGNCRWATREQQNRNSRRVRLGQQHADDIRAKASSGVGSLSLSREYGVARTTIQNVLGGRSWVRKAG